MIRYLHLPVVDDSPTGGGSLHAKGIVDVLELTFAVMTRAAGVDDEGKDAEHADSKNGVAKVGLQQLFGGGGGPGSTYNDDDDDRSSICSMTSVGSTTRLSANSQQHLYQQQQQQQQQRQQRQQQARQLSHRNLEQHQHGDGNLMSPLTSPTESALADFADLPDSASVVCMQQSNAPSVVASQHSHAPTHQHFDGEGHGGLPASFVCKVTDEDGRMFRIRLSALRGDGGDAPTPYPMCALREAVAAEAGLQDAAMTLKYVDDDGDEVTLSSDEGLADAVRLAATCEWKALKVSMSRPAASATAAVAATATAQLRLDEARAPRRSAMSGSTAGIAAAVLAVVGIGGFIAYRGQAPTLEKQ